MNVVYLGHLIVVVTGTHLIISSSKGISSRVLARLTGVRQPTAWRIGPAIRLMVDPTRSDSALLRGVVELYETYAGSTPQPKPGVVHNRGKGTAKQ